MHCSTAVSELPAHSRRVPAQRKHKTLLRSLSDRRITQLQRHTASLLHRQADSSSIEQTAQQKESLALGIAASLAHRG